MFNIYICGTLFRLTKAFSSPRDKQAVYETNVYIQIPWVVLSVSRCYVWKNNYELLGHFSALFTMGNVKIRNYMAILVVYQMQGV